MKNYYELSELCANVHRVVRDFLQANGANGVLLYEEPVCEWVEAHAFVR